MASSRNSEVFIPTNKQKFFTRHLIGVLLSLTVIGLIEEYWQYVSIDSFTVLLLMALLIQVALTFTTYAFDKVSVFFKGKSGFGVILLKVFCLVLAKVGSKLVLISGINFLFGERVVFSGAANGNLAFIVVVLSMIATEQIFLRIHRKLA